MAYNVEYIRRHCKDRKDIIMTIDVFRDEYRFLSNFWFVPVRFSEEYEKDGIVYPTVEHGYQAAKTIDWNQRRLIAALPKPGDAKRAGRQLKIRSNWDALKRSIMLDLLRSKFGANVALERLLLATGEQQLIEGNTWHDNYWGICSCATCSYIRSREEPQLGENWLGRLLMHVRLEIQL